MFKTRMKDSKTLERKIEKRLLKGLGYDVAVFIRTGAELRRLSVGRSPFVRVTLSKG